LRGRDGWGVKRFITFVLITSKILDFSFRLPTAGRNDDYHPMNDAVNPGEPNTSRFKAGSGFPKFLFKEEGKTFIFEE